MNEITKNSLTGLYNLQIDDRVFESEEAEHFIIDAKEIESALIGSLPLNVIIQLTKPDKYFELSLKHLDGDLVDIIISDVENWMNIDYVNSFIYDELKEIIIRAVAFSKKKIEFHDIDHDGDLFEYTMRFSATTVGEAFQLAMEINKSIDDRMSRVSEQGGNYMRLVANGAFQIDVSHIFSGKDKNSEV